MVNQGENMAAHLLNKCYQTAAELKRKYGSSLNMERPNRLLLECEKCGYIKSVEFPYDSNAGKKYEITCESCGNGIMRVTKY